VKKFVENESFWTIIKKNIKILDGSDTGEQAKMFFKYKKGKVSSERLYSGTDDPFTKITNENLEGVKEALLKAIAKLEQTLSPSPAPPFSQSVLPMSTIPPQLPPFPPLPSTPPSLPLFSHDYYIRLKKANEKSNISKKIAGMKHGGISDEFDISMKRLFHRINRFNEKLKAPTLASSSSVGATLTPVVEPLPTTAPSAGSFAPALSSTSSPPVSAKKNKTTEQSLVEKQASEKVYKNTSYNSTDNGFIVTATTSSEILFTGTRDKQHESNSITYGKTNPDTRTVTMVAEYFNDMQKALELEGKKIKEIMISNYESDPLAVLTNFCSHSILNVKIVPKEGDGFINYAGYYEVYLLLNKMLDSGNKDALMKLVQENSRMLNEMCEEAKKLREEKSRNGSNYGKDEAGKVADELKIKFEQKIQNLSGWPPSSLLFSPP